MTVEPSSRPDLSIDPSVKAKRKRQNRIIIAVAVMVLVPVLAVSGTKSYALGMINRWMESPTFEFNTETRVVLSGAGDYQVWALDSPTAQCTVTRNGQEVPSRNEDDLIAGFYLIIAFSVSEGSEFTFFCESAATNGYAMVTPPLPINQAGAVLVVGWLIGAVAAIVGLILLIVGLVDNASEKKGRRPPAQPQLVLIGPPPAGTYPPGVILVPHPPQAPYAPTPSPYPGPPYPPQPRPW